MMELSRNLKLYQQIYNGSIVVIWVNKKDSVPINHPSLGNIVYKGISIDTIPKSQYPIEKEKKKKEK